MQIRHILCCARLTAGVAASAVVLDVLDILDVLIMAATGTLVAVQPQIHACFERDVRAAPITIDVDPTRAASVNFARSRMEYLDSSSGRVLGTGATSARGAVQQITEWHR